MIPIKDNFKWMMSEENSAGNPNSLLVPREIPSLADVQRLGKIHGGQGDLHIKIRGRCLKLFFLRLTPYMQACRELAKSQREPSSGQHARKR